MSGNPASVKEVDIARKSPDRAEWIARAKKIGEVAESEAQEADQNARFSNNLAKAIEDAEIHKLMRTARYGGFSADLDLKTYVEILRTVASSSIPAAWITYFFSAHDVWAAYLTPEGRDEVLGSGGFLSDVLAPMGRVEKDGEGYRLSGQWNFCSGVLWAEWIGLGAMMELPDSKGPEPCLLVVHRSEVDIIENWNTIGLRASGSNGVSVEDVYVPPHRVLPTGRVMAYGKPVGGNYDENDPIYRMPFIPLFLLGFPAIALGGVDRLLSIFHERTEKRVRIFKEGVKAKDSVSSQRLYAEFKSRHSALEGLVAKYVDRLETWENEGKSVASDEEREELFALRGYVAKTAAEIAMDILLALGGTSIFKGDPVELLVRDLIAFAAHPNHSYEDSMEAYGRTTFGLPGDPVW